MRRRSKRKLKQSNLTDDIQKFMNDTSLVTLLRNSKRSGIAIIVLSVLILYYIKETHPFVVCDIFNEFSEFSQKFIKVFNGLSFLQPVDPSGIMGVMSRVFPVLQKMIPVMSETVTFKEDNFVIKGCKNLGATKDLFEEYGVQTSVQPLLQLHKVIDSKVEENEKTRINISKIWPGKVSTLRLFTIQKNDRGYTSLLNKEGTVTSAMDTLNQIEVIHKSTDQMYRDLNTFGPAKELSEIDDMSKEVYDDLIKESKKTDGVTNPVAEKTSIIYGVAAEPLIAITEDAHISRSLLDGTPRPNLNAIVTVRRNRTKFKVLEVNNKIFRNSWIEKQNGEPFYEPSYKAGDILQVHQNTKIEHLESISIGNHLKIHSHKDPSKVDRNESIYQIRRYPYQWTDRLGYFTASAVEEAMMKGSWEMIKQS